MQKPAIVVVGSINMDLVSRVPTFPRPGETVRGSAFAMHGGGKGANQAVGVARLSHPVRLIGMVGNDAFGAQLKGSLQSEAVDTAHVGTAKGPSGTATVLVNSEGENSIVVCPGANAVVTPELLRSKKDVIAAAGMVLAQLEIPLEAVVELAALCGQAGVPFMLDPAPATALPESVWRHVAWITPNETEAAFYVPHAESPAARAAALRKLGAANVLLKQGASGSTAVSADGSVLHTPAREVRGVGTTAAGDAFNAAFAVALLENRSLGHCAAFASAAAAVSVTRPGAQQSLASRAEVEAMLQR